MESYYQIKDLENGSVSSTKAPIKNRHPPLKGLWHKHYLESGMKAVAMNVDRGLKKYGIPYFEQRIKEAPEAGEERYLSEEDIPALVDSVVSGNWQRLSEEKTLTGEWIIFAKYEGKNYYLCLATHDKASHEYMRQNIDKVCCVEFPFLVDLLEQ